MNLFIIAQLGSLFHHQALIKRDKLTNNKLAILYTNANLHIPKKIENTADRSLFDYVEFVELPLKPNNYNLQNINKMIGIYTELLSGIDHLYTSNFEKHYNICHKIACKMNIKTHLIEEGLATYKFSHSGLKLDKPNTKDERRKILQNCGLIENKCFPIVKTLYYIGRDLYRLPMQIIKAIKLERNSEHRAYKLLAKLTDERNAFINYSSNFDTINIAFPDAIRNVFSANEIKTLNTYNYYDIEEDIYDTVKMYNINNDMLYLTQNYPIQNFNYAKAIIEIIKEQLMEKNIRRCFIKFHPRNNNDFIKAIQNVIIKADLSDKIIALTLSESPVESLIKACQFRCILSICSTPLVYAKQLSERAECISITNKLITKLSSNCSQNAKKILIEHTNMLKIFDHIEFL